MEKLKPCFCGNIPILVNDTNIDNTGAMRDSWHIECRNCGMFDLSLHPNEEAAVNSWNKALTGLRKEG